MLNSAFRYLARWRVAIGDKSVLPAMRGENNTREAILAQQG
ncbi:MAG: hypothetical protein ACERIE_05505 [Methyloceanibacter sp.]|jgi:hypothetical protein